MSNDKITGVSNVETEEAVHEHHHVSMTMYYVVFGVLLIGTILTVAVAFVDLDRIFPGLNTIVALLIAFTKATFVTLYFMHVKYSGRFIWICAVAGILFLMIMFAFTMQDVLTRKEGFIY